MKDAPGRLRMTLPAIGAGKGDGAPREKLLDADAHARSPMSDEWADGQVVRGAVRPHMIAALRRASEPGFFAASGAAAGERPVSPTPSSSTAGSEELSWSSSEMLLGEEPMAGDEDEEEDEEEEDASCGASFTADFRKPQKRRRKRRRRRLYFGPGNARVRCATMPPIDEHAATDGREGWMPSKVLHPHFLQSRQHAMMPRRVALAALYAHHSTARTQGARPALQQDARKGPKLPPIKYTATATATATAAASGAGVATAKLSAACLTPLTSGEDSCEPRPERDF